jgi:hypothetical protein
MEVLLFQQHEIRKTITAMVYIKGKRHGLNKLAISEEL